MGELKKISGTLGEVFISEKAIAQICAKVISEQEGLRTPKQAREGTGLWQTLTKAVKGNGVEVLKEDNKLIIKLSLFAKYGIQINEAAQRAIQEIKARVKELAALEIDEVLVEITGIVK
jgi:uncharacterized alkaline shock family protein YloU